MSGGTELRPYTSSMVAWLRDAVRKRSAAVWSMQKRARRAKSVKRRHMLAARRAIASDAKRRVSRSVGDEG